MQHISFQLPDHLAGLLEKACAESGTMRDSMMKELVIQYLEDLEDYRDAMNAVAEGGTPIPLEALERKHGLAD
jgi:predicted DNA-binding protein